MDKFLTLYHRYFSLVNSVLIFLLALLLLKVAYLDPLAYTEAEEAFKKEARSRLHNLRTAQRAFFEKHGRFSGNIDSLVSFVRSLEAATVLDTIKDLDTNTFSFRLSDDGNFYADSMKYSTKVYIPFHIQLDTVRVIDSVFSEKGKFVRVDTTFTLGSRFRVIDPSGYGSIGNLFFDALIYSASWE